MTFLQDPQIKVWQLQIQSKELSLFWSRESTFNGCRRRLLLGSRSVPQSPQFSKGINEAPPDLLCSCFLIKVGWCWAKVHPYHFIDLCFFLPDSLSIHILAVKYGFSLSFIGPWSQLSILLGHMADVYIGCCTEGEANSFPLVAGME